MKRRGDIKVSVTDESESRKKDQQEAVRHDQNTEVVGAKEMLNVEGCIHRGGEHR